MNRHGIEAAGIPFGSCRLTRGYKLRKIGFEPRSVYFGLIPYYTHECDLPRSVSAYAVSKDYHLFIEEAGALITEEAKAVFPGAGFAVFGDSSPFDERDGAARAGLGVSGRNGIHLRDSQRHPARQGACRAVRLLRMRAMRRRLPLRDDG